MDKDMKVIARGSESTILDCGDTVIKRRERKGYRIKEIDEKLRKSRTKAEFSLIKRCNAAGINVPTPIKIDGFDLHLQKIRGKLLRDDFTIHNMALLGKLVAKMHGVGVVHGDLTTANVISSDDGLFMIDFGLGYTSKKDEDRATDVFLLKSALKAMHTEHYDDAYAAFLASYEGVLGKEFKGIQTHLTDIEERRRYHEND